jgi:hypothetical protein
MSTHRPWIRTVHRPIGWVCVGAFDAEPLVIPEQHAEVALLSRVCA